MSAGTSNVSAAGTGERWKVLGGTVLAYFYDSYDLAILAVAMPAIIKVLNIKLGLGGFLASSTMIGAAVGSMIFGVIAENYGRRLAIVLSLVEFGLGTGCILLVNSWGAWMVLRFLTGIGIGGVWGPSVALLAQHWAPRYMARANAFMLSTFALGWIAASYVGRIVFNFSWKYLFLLGTTSILVAMYAWWALPADRPVRRSRDNPVEKRIGLSSIFEKTIARRTVLATLQNACQMGGYWGAATWIPTFLVRERGLGMTNMAGFVALLYIGAFCGYQLFGYIGDRLGRRNAILLCFAVECGAVSTYLLISDVTFLYWFGPVMGMGFGGVFGLTGAFYAELFPQNIRALAGGFCFNVGRLGAVIAPFTVGYIGQAYGLRAGIVTSPVIFALGLLVTGFLPETLVKEPKAKAAIA
jgi:MFS family permease